MPTGSAQRSPTVTLTATLALLSFVTPLATDMYLPAFPRMAAELGTDAPGVQLTLTAFLLGMAAGQLTLGPLSDRLGRRLPILIGAGICTLATAMCAMTTTLEILIVLRFVTGFSAAAGVVVGRAIIVDVASGPVAARLFGVLMTLGGLAPIVAPLAGGAVLSGAGDWRAVFWTLAAASLLMFLAALRFLPESLPHHRRRRGGLTATIQAARAVLTDRVYVGYALAFTFAFGALFCYIAGSPFLLQNVLKFSVEQASVVFAAGALTATLSSALGTRLIGRWHPTLLLRVGLFTMLAATAALLIIAVTGQLSRLPALVLCAVAFLGLGQVFGTATALAIERVPHAAGTGSAMLGTSQMLLGAGVAPLMGIGGSDTALPLFTGMATCSSIAVLALLLTRNASESRTHLCSRRGLGVGDGQFGDR